MIRSMTGYGRRETRWERGSITAEVRSVNHRFCEVVMRLPKGLAALEKDLRHAVQQRCARGRIELTVTASGGEEGKTVLNLDRTMAKQYYRILRELQRELHLGGSVDLALLAGFREVVTVSKLPVEAHRMDRAVKRLVIDALADLHTMRCREGRTLERDLRNRVAIIDRELDAVSARAPLVVQESFARMKGRVERLIGLGEADGARLRQELALFADRADLTEELTRLDSHLHQFTRALKDKGAVGKTLDFLLQEMAREINTIGSKANDAEITTHVVRVKGELEKLREQVQNIE